MLVIPNVITDKNPEWYKDTPNERYLIDEDYKTIANAFAEKGGVGGQRRFFEVRIVNRKSLLTLEDSARWWNDPAFMDKVFWVYQTPVILHSDNAKYFAYQLEFWESQRVLKEAFNKFGRNPFNDQYPALLIPTDCVQLCWEETKGGYSEHIRPRAPHNPTQEEIDKEAGYEEFKSKVWDKIVDISDRVNDNVKGAV